MKIDEIYTEKFMNEFPKPHYLLNKDLEEWDEYDWYNYRAIVNKIHLNKKTETEEVDFYKLLRKLKKELFDKELGEYPTQFIESLKIIIQ